MYFVILPSHSHSWDDYANFLPKSDARRGVLGGGTRLVITKNEYASVILQMIMILGGTYRYLVFLVSSEYLFELSTLRISPF